MPRVLALCCLSLLSACTSSLESLRAKNPQGDSFGVSLAAEYLAYAESEAEWQHSDGAERAAAKGLRALAGEEVQPDKPDPRLAGAEAAYARVLMLLADERMRQTQMEAMARLVVMYDCWMGQFGKAYQPGCGDEMTALLAELERAQKKLPKLMH